MGRQRIRAFHRSNHCSIFHLWVVEMCDCISDVAFHAKGLFKEAKAMNKFPEKIRKKLKKEALAWDASISSERVETVETPFRKGGAF